MTLLSGQAIVERGIVARAAPEQIQPNGVDLRLADLWRLAERGALGLSDAERTLPAREPLPFDANGWADLAAGAFGFRFVDVVRLPADCGALVFPRSSLLRMGVYLPTAVWDAGYEGRAEGLLVVANPAGARLQRGARIAQLIVLLLGAPTTPYSGRYQGESLA